MIHKYFGVIISCHTNDNNSILMKSLFLYIFIFFTYGIISCNNPKKNLPESVELNELPDRPINPEHNSYRVQVTGFDTAQFNLHYKSRIDPPAINLNQSLDDKSISDLELLKSTLLAMKGNIFNDAIYSAYFDTIPWFQPPYWDENFTLELNEDEQWFIERINHKVSTLQKDNYTDEQLPNTRNIVNSFQWSNQYFNEKLQSNGFFLTKSELNQPFEVYEQNAINNIPSFITTDLIMHQMHLFYGMLENEIEEIYLTEKLKSMLETINVALYASYEKTLDPIIEKAIEESLLYYSIPYAVITGKKTNLIGSYNQQYVDELTKVLSGSGVGSIIMNDDQFDYSVFKPYQHYAKNDKITKYYKALTWLQKIDLCLNHENDFRKAIIVAYIINENIALQNEYREFIELKTYFSSQKEQFTLWDLANEIKKIDSIKKFEDLFNEENASQLRENLSLNNQEQCQTTISLMPIEYQNRFTDLNEIAQNSSAISIDLFAALDNPAAKQMYLSNQENNLNQEYLDLITENLVIISAQENARSMDWLSTLLTSFNLNFQNQQYMTKMPWKKKELASAMSSWILLNQRVNLQAAGKKSSAVNKMKDKVLIGYVEPNQNFWNASKTLLTNTKVFFSDRGMLSKKSSNTIEEFIDLVIFLDGISQKELANISLNIDDYTRINGIGSQCHNLSLKMINPNFNSSNQKIKTNMAYATYLHHSVENKNVIGGIGGPGCILAIVEIEGRLYLTKGAVYNYYEIPDYSRRNITQSQWKKLLNNNLKPIEWAQLLYSDTDVHNLLVASNQD